MEAFGIVLPRPIALFSTGGTESVCQRKAMKIISSSRKLGWSRGISNSAFLDMGHLEYYYSDRSPEIRCRKVFAGEKKMKKKDSESKEKKKRLKMLKGLSRDLLMLSKSGFGLDSNPDNIYLDREVKPEMISDALVHLQGEMQQLLTREKELKMKSKEEKKNRSKAEETRNLESEMLSSCSSESSDSECNSERTDVLLHSDIGMQEDIVVFLQGQLQQLRNKEKEVKQKRKEEKRRLKAAQMQKLDDCSSDESSDSECEKLSNMNTLSCYPLLAEKISSGLPAVTEAVLHRDLMQEQSGNGLQDSTATLSSIFQSTEVFEDNMSRVKDFEQGCGSEILKNFRQDSEFAESTKRIEVCMGGKCKKSGAVLLMDEFQRRMGIEGAVSGCKCMGKCKNGPNVRVLQSNDTLAAANPLCLSVGLDDVSSIVANFLGQESGLPAASYGEI